MSNETKCPWSPRQITMFVKDAKAPIGNGWKFLVPEIQVAVIRSKALAVVQQQDREEVSVAAVDQLRMLEEAGLEDV